MKPVMLGLWAVMVMLLVGCGQKGGGSAKHPWGSFKVGSYVKTRMTSAMNVAGKPINTTSEMKQTLVELTAVNAVIEMEVTVLGKTTTTRKEFPLAMKTPLAGTPAAGANKVLNKGTETLSVGGKLVSCKWSEATVTQGANIVTVKFYSSEQVPGFIVKMVTKMTGGMNSDTTHEVIEFLAK